MNFPVKHLPILVAAFTRGGGERIETALPTELTTFWMGAFQARRSCASSLDTFTQSFHHCAWPKTPGLARGSRSALIVVACVFSWPHVLGREGRRRPLISSPLGRIDAWPNKRNLLLDDLRRCTSETEAVPQFYC